MKKVTSILLSLFLMLTLLPTTALAETGGTADTHTPHCICGATHTDVGDHETENVLTGWEAVSEASQLTSINADGTYYLANDVTLSSKWTIPNGVEVTLCLNGKTLTANNASVADTILIEGTLNITDCGNGTITGNNTSNTGSHKAIVVSTVYADCTLNLYGGTITGINAGDGSGGGVHNEGIFNMYGGKITGNTAKNGGGVYNEGTFNMYGGSITGNTAKGGGVYSATNTNKKLNPKTAEFNFYGGTISGNKTTKGESGDVYIANSNTTMNANGGTVAGGVTNKGTIAANGTTSTTFNGAVKNTGTISGGTFSGTVTNDGTVNNGTFTGNVTNNATINGGTFGSSSTVTNETDGSISGGTFNGTVYDKSEGGITEGVDIPNKVPCHEILSWDSITSATAGCTLDSDTNTLTLTNVYIDKLEVPRTKNITIKISGNVTINTLKPPKEGSGSSVASYAATGESSSVGSITIVSRTGRTTDTLYSGKMINSDGNVTIQDLTANLMKLSSAGSLKLTNSKVTVGDGKSLDNQIVANSVTMDDTSILVLKKAVICALSKSEQSNGLSGLANFLPDGYGFIGKEVSGSAAGTYAYTIVLTTNKTETAISTTLQRYYNVTFNPNGGKIDNSDEPVTKRVLINTDFSNINIDTPTKDGFTFDKWTDAQTGGKQVEKITEDITLYAQWKDNSTTHPDTKPNDPNDPKPNNPNDNDQSGSDQSGNDKNPNDNDQNGGSTTKRHYAKKTNSADANSAKTFDAGVAVYGVLAVSAALGMGYVGKKKF